MCPFKWKLLSTMSTFLFYALRGDSNFWICEWNPMVWPFIWKLLRVWAVLFCGTVYFSVQRGYNTWVLTKSWRVTPSYKSHWAVLSCGTVYWNCTSLPWRGWINSEVQCYNPHEINWTIQTACGAVWHDERYVAQEPHFFGAVLLRVTINTPGFDQ